MYNTSPLEYNGGVIMKKTALRLADECERIRFNIVSRFVGTP